MPLLISSAVIRTAEEFLIDYGNLLTWIEIKPYYHKI